MSSTTHQDDQLLASTATITTDKRIKIYPLTPLTPDLHQRAWSSTPHPTLPLLATSHSKSVTIYSLTSLSTHSVLSGGHTRSIRSTSWKPDLSSSASGGSGEKLCLVTGSFDSTAGLWRLDSSSSSSSGDHVSYNNKEDEEWEFTLVLEGHDSEIKSCVFSPSGNLLATSSRDKSIWIWEDIGASEEDDEWETIAVLTDHEGDVKSLAWCPDVPGRKNNNNAGNYGEECLVSASYDDTARIWREDADGEWVCVSVLEGHGGTVWGIGWEGLTAVERFPRVVSGSADGTVRIWSLKQDEQEEETEEEVGGLGRIPNRMRRSLREEWVNTSTLPTVHQGDVYSVAWSGISGLIASTGSDGVLAVYEEVPVVKGEGGAEGKEKEWQVVDRVEGAHGPFEVNHVTWCKRWEGGEGVSEEEMLVTTGDDGVVRRWRAGM